MNMETIIEQLKVAKIPTDIIDYVFEQTTVSPTTDFRDYEKMLKIMFDNGLSIDDKFMINAYKLSVEKNCDGYLFYFFRSESITIPFDKIVDLLVKSGMEKSFTISRLSVIYNQPELLENYFDNFETDFFNYVERDFEDLSVESLSLLLKKNFEKYIDFIKNKILIVSKSNYYSNYSKIINLIKDDNFTEEYFIIKIVRYVKAKADSLINSNVKRCLINYLKTGVFEKDFDTVITQFLKGFGKYDTDFYYLFLEGFDLDLSKQFHKNLLNLSLKIDYDSTLRGLIDLNNEKSLDENIKTLEKIIKDNVISNADLFSFLIGRTEFKYPEASLINQIEYMIKNYYDDCIESIQNASNKIVALGIKQLFQENRERAFDFVLSFSNTKSEAIKKSIIETLSGYNRLEEYKKLLNSKKASEREIGQILVASLN